MNTQRITRYNFDKIFPNSPMSFATLNSKPGSVDRQMKEKNTFNTVRYMLINDIIDILKRGIKENRSPNRKHTEKWKKFLENDIQEYLDNRKEMLNNET